MINTVAYLVYLLLALIVVLAVGRILFRNGRFYLLEIFGQESPADAINRILYAGYCLVNAGGAFNCLVRAGRFTEYREAMEYVIVNQGQLLLLLGGMHALNLVILPLLKSFFRNKFHRSSTDSLTTKNQSS